MPLKLLWSENEKKELKQFKSSLKQFKAAQQLNVIWLLQAF